MWDRWTEKKNSRRCDLIDKEIDGTITESEQDELNDLQQQMVLYRKKRAPLPDPNDLL